MDNLGQQLRQCLRSLCKSPVFSITTFLILAIGIGANIVVFGILNSLLLQTLPFRNPDRIAIIGFAAEQRGLSKGLFSWQRVLFLRQNHASLQTFAVWAQDTASLTGGGDPEQLTGARVSSDLLKVLGLTPAFGRDFLPGEDQKGASPVVLISYELWQRRFGGSQSVIGRPVNLDSVPFVVVGVLPPRLQYPRSNLDFWIPQPYALSYFKPSEIAIGAAYLSGIGRLEDGLSFDQAQAQFEIGHRQYVREFPNLLDAYPGATAEISPLREKMLGNLRRPLFTLASAVALVLLIACANVAGLLLARGTARSREMAVRASLGATRAGLMRQIFTEGLILAIAGGVLGVGVAWMLIRGLAGAVQKYLPGGQGIRIDSMLLLFALALAVVTGIIFSVAPALQIGRSDINSALRQEGRGTSAGWSGARSRRWLVVGQVAVSMVLLTCATLLIESFRLLQSADPGFDPRQTLTMKLYFSPTRYPDADKRRSYARELLRKLDEMPGVSAGTMAFSVPLASSVLIPVQIIGHPAVSVNERPLVQFQTIRSNYFDVLHVPLRKGRMFTEFDNENVALIAIVNEKMARRFWPNEEAIGKRLQIPGTAAPLEIVGVVGDVKNVSLKDDVQEAFYVPYSQFPLPRAVLMLRTNAEAGEFIGRVKETIQSVDPAQAVTEVATLDELVSGDIGRTRLILVLLTSFSATAMFLAMMGLYGVLAYSVAQRRQELAVRMAVGSSPSGILALVVRQGLHLVLTGAVLGTVASFLLTPLMGPLLYGVAATDPRVFLLSVALLVVSGVSASFFPAYEASRIDPITALR